MDALEVFLGVIVVVLCLVLVVVIPIVAISSSKNAEAERCAALSAAYPSRTFRVENGICSVLLQDSWYDVDLFTVAIPQLEERK